MADKHWGASATSFGRGQFRAEFYIIGGSMTDKLSERMREYAGHSVKTDDKHKCAATQDELREWADEVAALEQENAELREKIQRFGTLAVSYIRAYEDLAFGDTEEEA